MGMIVRLVDSDGVVYRSTDIIFYEGEAGDPYNGDIAPLEVPCWIGCVDPTPNYFTGFVP